MGGLGRWRCEMVLEVGGQGVLLQCKKKCLTTRSESRN